MFGNIPFPTLDQMDLDVAEKKNVANPFLPSRVAPPNYKIFADLAKYPLDEQKRVIVEELFANDGLFQNLYWKNANAMNHYLGLLARAHRGENADQFNRAKVLLLFADFISKRPQELFEYLTDEIGKVFDEAGQKSILNMTYQEFPGKVFRTLAILETFGFEYPTAQQFLLTNGTFSLSEHIYYWYLVVYLVWIQHQSKEEALLRRPGGAALLAQSKDDALAARNQAIEQLRKVLDVWIRQVK
jgi:hypothetical protein